MTVAHPSLFSELQFQLQYNIEVCREPADSIKLGWADERIDSHHLIFHCDGREGCHSLFKSPRLWREHLIGRQTHPLILDHRAVYCSKCSDILPLNTEDRAVHAMVSSLLLF